MNYIDELIRIAQRHRGILRAEDVIAFARDPKTALHSRFTWDDTKAAHEYRLEQARRLVRVTVTMIPNTKRTFRVFSSLKDDRQRKGGGYRYTARILSDRHMREQLLAEMYDDIDALRRKYRTLKEFAPVIKAIDVVLLRKEQRSVGD